MAKTTNDSTPVVTDVPLGRRYEFDGARPVILTRAATIIEEGVDGIVARVWEDRGWYGIEAYACPASNDEWPSLARAVEYVARNLPRPNS